MSNYVPVSTSTTTTTTRTAPPAGISIPPGAPAGHVGYVTEQRGIKGHHTVMHPVIVSQQPGPTQIIQPVMQPQAPPPQPPPQQQPIVVQQPPVNIHIDNTDKSPQAQQPQQAQPAASPPTTIINNKV